MISHRRLAWGLAFAFALAPANGFGQAAPSPTGVTREQADRTFATMLDGHARAGRLVEALAVLESRPDLAGDPAVQRLRAELLFRLDRSDEAQAVLEARLSADPEDAVARFQVAEQHFAAHRDAAAQLAYRLALAGNLDSTRRGMAQTRLSQIRARRDWRFSAGLSLAPDSNLNSGANTDIVEIFGVPFALDEAAQRQGGVAVTANAGAERRFTLGPKTRLSAAGSLWLSRAEGPLADVEFITVRGGVERLIRGGVWSLEPDMDFIRQAGRLTQTTRGVTASIERQDGGRTALDASIRVAQVDDRFVDTRDGWSYLGRAGRTAYLNPSSLLRTSVAVERRDLNGPSESVWYGRVAQGVLAPLPASISAYVEPYAAVRRYDAPNSFFGEARRDFEAGISIRLSKRDWVWRGANPFISLSAGRNKSNIALYTYSRERVEFGLTRQF